MNAPDKAPELLASEAEKAVADNRPKVSVTSRKLQLGSGLLGTLSVLAKDSQLDPKKQADAIRKVLKEIGNEEEEDQKTFFLAFYETLRRYNAVMTYDADGAGVVEIPQILAMRPLSRKKLATFVLKNEIGKRYDLLPEGERASRMASGESRDSYVKKRLRSIYAALSIHPEDMIGGLNEAVGMSDAALRFHEAYFTNQTSWDSLDSLMDEFGLDADLIIQFAEDHPELQINVAKLKRSVGLTDNDGQQNLASNLLAPVEKPVNAQVAKVLDLELREVEANGFINPNWFLYDISTYLGIKLYGEPKTRYVFGTYFFNAVRQMDEKFDLGLQYPDFYNLCNFRLAKTGPDGKPSQNANGKPELIDVAHHVFEWVVPSDFDFAKLKELAATLRGAIPELLTVSARQKDFRHPVKTVSGRQTYVGYFTDAKDFENTNLLLLKPNEKGGETRIRISTDVPQDQFLYLLAQTSRFVAQGDFIDPKQLWTLIYRAYNRLSTENVTTFDITVFEEQYRELVRNVIWPLSREYYEEHGKPGRAHHTALVGLYGTGKSQFLLNLLSKKEFEFGGQTLHLNANTVNIGLMDFVDLLTKNASDFKKRLSDIHENTKLPIIIIIEDIDTLINEEGGKSDIVTQAMTNFLEGVGSMPVTVITSSNYPERLSDRLIRPNRFDRIVPFNLPLPEKIVREAFANHVKRNGLEKVFADAGLDAQAVADEFVPRMKDFTTSHVGSFIEAIRHDYEFEKKFNPEYRPTMESLNAIFGSILVSVDDIQMRQKTITAWYEKLLDRNGKQKMGF